MNRTLKRAENEKKTGKSRFFSFKGGIYDKIN
jgi:hypothetical protein